jgi:hypothetical protein
LKVIVPPEPELDPDSVELIEPAEIALPTEPDAGAEAVKLGLVSATVNWLQEPVAEA